MSKERYVELMVVTDSTMAAYHGENLKHYVLTLLSIVIIPFSIKSSQLTPEAAYCQYNVRSPFSCFDRSLSSTRMQVLGIQSTLPS